MKFLDSPNTEAFLRCAQAAACISLAGISCAQGGWLVIVGIVWALLSVQFAQLAVACWEAADQDNQKDGENGV